MGAGVGLGGGAGGGGGGGGGGYTVVHVSLLSQRTELFHNVLTVTALKRYVCTHTAAIDAHITQSGSRLLVWCLQ